MKKGVLLGLITAVISGASIFANALFVSKTDPLIFALTRNVMVAVVFTLVLITLGHVKRLRLLTRRQWGLLFTIGAVGGGIPFALFFIGLSQIGAVSGNIIQKTLFLWVAVLAVPILHERLSKVQLLGYASLFIGLFVFGGTAHVVWKIGAWLVLAATVLWSIENVITKVTLRSVHPAIVCWGRIVFGLPFLLAAAAVTGKIGLLSIASSYAVTPIVVSSAFLTIYMLTWYSALSMAPATLISSVLVFAPVITALLGQIVLKKAIVGQGVINIVLLITGTICLVCERLLPRRRDVSV